MSNYWGYHLMLDCSGLNHTAITNKDIITAFIKELVWRIDMIAFGEPMVEHFATHDPDKAGISFVQMIETSNLTGHFVDLDNTAYIDVFSCKPFNNEDVINTVREFFETENTKIRVNYITRHAS